MSTHAARVTHSDRLRRVLDVLLDGAEHTTLDLMQSAHVCAVNAIVDELRGNGYRITCQRRGDRWFYQLQLAEVRRA
jgi:hypothetical protein